MFLSIAAHLLLAASLLLLILLHVGLKVHHPRILAKSPLVVAKETDQPPAWTLLRLKERSRFEGELGMLVV